jgi:hypothetical protein
MTWSEVTKALLANISKFEMQTFSQSSQSI